MVQAKKRKQNLYKTLRYLFDLLEIEITNKVLAQLLDEQKTRTGSIQDLKHVLSDLEIDSRLFSVDYEDLLDLECPFIAHLEEETGFYVVITECSKETIKYFDTENGNVNEPNFDFKKKWSGIILVPLTSQQSGDPEFKKNLQQETMDRRLEIAFISIIIMCLILILLKTNIFILGRFIIWAIFFFCKILGMVISVLIVKIEFGDSNPVIRRLCSKYECEKVLHSDGSKIFTWLSMGDIGMIYFSGGFLLLATTYNNIYSFLNILAIINIFTLPYTLYSVFYQWRIAKAFCPFCCTVIIILWTEFLAGFYMSRDFSSVELYDVIHSAINYLITIVVWFILKCHISKSLFANSYKSVLSGIKKDVELFNSTLNARPPVPELSISNEIIMGDFNAQNTLIAVLSPNCHSCNQLYFELKSFSQQFPDRLKIILRFKGFEEEKSETNKVIDWIITMHLLSKSITSLELYESWNTMKFHGLKKWEEKNQLLNKRILFEAIQVRLIYTRWINSLDIPGTPALIFNGKILPLYYSFNDIRYLIRRIYEK